jgi:transcriptional regulator with XRE-family HTH domain
MHTKGKPYRDAFVAAHLSTNIAAQLEAMREARGWRQKDVAEKTGMSPARISVMEDPSYEKYNLTTLKRLASTFDVALYVCFIPYSDLVDKVAAISPDTLNVPSFDSDTLRPAAPAGATYYPMILNGLWGGQPTLNMLGGAAGGSVVNNPFSFAGGEVGIVGQAGSLVRTGASIGMDWALQSPAAAKITAATRSSIELVP